MSVGGALTSSSVTITLFSILLSLRTLCGPNEKPALTEKLMHALLKNEPISLTTTPSAQIAKQVCCILYLLKKEE
jgi:hypothetical protein